MEEKRTLKKLTGVVVSDKMEKTVVIQVNRLVEHPIYKKFIHRRSKFKVHDEQNQARVGDTVEVVQSRPLSKTKNWRLSKILSREA